MLEERVKTVLPKMVTDFDGQGACNGEAAFGIIYETRAVRGLGQKTDSFILVSDDGTAFSDRTSRSI